MFKGSFVALITPMTSSGLVDESALCELVEWHIKNKTHGLVPVGTTGESPVLSNDEHKRVIELVVEQAANRLPVIAGAGSNNTKEAENFHAHAFDTGADAALHVTGYYNKPSQEGIYQHFLALSKLNSLPIIIYDIPPRTNVEITLETMLRLSQINSVVGVKDATKDLSKPCLESITIDKAFSLLSGEDATAVAYNASGGCGCISVTANVLPKQCSDMQAACLAGDFTTAIAIQKQLTPLHQALFLEPSPAGIKYACSRIGLCNETTRLPMVALTRETRTRIDEALSHF